MTSLFALRTLLFAGELLTASLLVLAIVWLVASPKSASARHLAWAGAFGVLLALPALAALLPSLTQILLPAPPQLPSIPMSNETLMMAPVPNPPSHNVFDFETSDIVLALGVLWLVGFVLIFGRFAIGAACLAVLKHKSRPFALAPGDEPKVATRGRECELRLCERDTGPITWGVLRPIILLPRTAISWPRERLHAVLLHELAHIRRRDSLANMISQAACALYWPNPLVWIAAAKLRREAEIAADDAVINAGIKPSTYASELLALAQEFRARQTAFAGMALFMAQPSSLEARVESVLAPVQQRSGVTSMDVLKIAGLGLCAATVIALACPSLAQETTPSASTATSAPVASAELPPAAAAPAPEAPAQPDAAPVVQHHHMHVADEVPPALPAPPAPATAAAPSMPAMPALPAAPPAPPALSVTRPDGSRLIINDANGTHVWVDGHYYGKLSAADRKHIREDIEAAKREARSASENARRETEEAIRQARVSERAVRAVQPDIDRARAEIERHRGDIERAQAEVARHRADIERAEQAVRDAKPQIDAAAAEIARHKGEIEAAMAKVQPEIDAAMAKVRAEMAKQHIDVKISEHVDAALKRAEIRIRAAETHVRDRNSDQDDDGDVQNRVEERTDTTDDQ